MIMLLFLGVYSRFCGRHSLPQFSFSFSLSPFILLLWGGSLGALVSSPQKREGREKACAKPDDDFFASSRPMPALLFFSLSCRQIIPFSRARGREHSEKRRKRRSKSDFSPEFISFMPTFRQTDFIGYYGTTLAPSTKNFDN